MNECEQSNPIASLIRNVHFRMLVAITILSRFSFLTNGLFQRNGSPGLGAVPSACACSRARVTRARWAMRRRSAAVVLRSSSGEGAASAARDADAAATTAAGEGAEATLAAAAAAEAEAAAAAGVCPLRCCADAAEFLPLPPAPSTLLLPPHSPSSSTLSPPNSDPGAADRFARPPADAAAAVCSGVGVAEGDGEGERAPPLERYRRLMNGERSERVGRGVLLAAAEQSRAVSPVKMRRLFR